MPGLVKGEKSEHVVSSIHWPVRIKTSPHLPEDPNFFGINLMEKAEKYRYFTENIDRKEQQDGGNVEVGQMHCRQKKIIVIRRD